MSHKQETRFNLRYNRLEEEMQKIVYSFNLALNLFLTSKYNLRNNHIYTTGKLYHTFAFFYMLLMNACCFYRMVVLGVAESNNNDQFEWSVLMSLLVFYFFNNLIGFTTMFVLDLVHNKNIVLLILEIQSIHRKIGFKHGILSFVIWNWVSLATTICYSYIKNMLFYVSWHYQNVVELVIDIVMHTLLITIHLNVVIATRIIILLRKYLEEWINIINTNVHDDNEVQELLDIYRNIIEAYNLFKKIYQFLVLYYTFSTFNHCLTYLHMIILSMRMTESLPIYSIICTLSLVLWELNDLTLATAYCMNCQKFYIVVNEAEMACILLLKKNDYSKNQEHLFKNIMHMNRVFSQMNACGLFYVNAALPLSLVGSIGYYTIVLLQFYLY